MSLRPETCYSCRVNLQVGHVQNQQVVFRWCRARTPLIEMCELQVATGIWQTEHDARVTRVSLKVTDHGESESIAVERQDLGQSVSRAGHADFDSLFHTAALARRDRVPKRKQISLHLFHDLIVRTSFGQLPLSIPNKLFALAILVGLVNQCVIAKALTERYQVLGSIFHSERSPLLDPPIIINLTPITWLFETSPTPIPSNLASGLS